VAPDVFIPLAEYTGLIVEIGDWVFSEACRQIVQWDSSGLPAFRVGINISAAQFREVDFVTKISAAIERSGVDPARLELEITESVAMEDPDSVARQLRELKALGLKVAVDDFGCGFSSLGSLNRLPFDRIKIDRAFVRELTPMTSQDCIARLIVKLAKSLGLEVIAEGVETVEQARLLEEMGCKEMQGYLYGRPMSADALEGWINRDVVQKD
jgi:EAL domain-containing protein (putative c-di-GMP-specific phosphodiesterase class I)